MQTESASLAALRQRVTVDNLLALIAEHAPRGGWTLTQHGDMRRTNERGNEVCPICAALTGAEANPNNAEVLPCPVFEHLFDRPMYGESIEAKEIDTVVRAADNANAEPAIRARLIEILQPV